MKWYGKIIGGVLGFLVGGPVGAVVGVVLGHQFDRGFGRPRPHRRSRRRIDPAEERLFIDTAFLAMGRLAKADGRVTEGEIAAARRCMDRMRLGTAERRRAIECFNRGKASDSVLDDQLGRLAVSCRGQPEIPRALLQVQVEFLLEKGHIVRVERELLWRLADRLRVGRVELAQIEAMVRARRSFGGRERTGRRRERPTLDSAYRVLGLSPGSADDEVKRAYRRLMSRHHPDKQAARGVPDSELRGAEQRTREIRAAYELIRDRRGIR